MCYHMVIGGVKAMNEKTLFTPQEIGARIRERRKELRLTLPQLAERMGVNKSTIIRYESYGIDPKKNYLIVSMAEALETTPEYLTGLSDAKEYDTYTLCMKALEKHTSEYLDTVTSSIVGEPRQQLMTSILGEVIDMYAILTQHVARAMAEADRIAEDEGLKESLRRYAIESGEITERAYRKEMSEPIEDMKKLFDCLLRLYDVNEKNIIGQIYAVKEGAREKLAAKIAEDETKGT